MNFLARILNLFPNPQPVALKETRFECPNCWGTQEWDGIERQAADQLSKDTTVVGRSREGFIQRFANRYLTRPTLRK